MRASSALLITLLALTLMPGTGQQAPRDLGKFERLPATVLEAELRGVEGSTFKLADYAGKVLVINLWASWVIPSRLEAPELEKLQKRYASRGVVVVGLSIEDPDETGRVVSEWIQYHKVHYRFGWATPDVSTALMQGQELVPQTFVVSGTGRIVKRFLGFNQTKTPSVVGEAIERALNEPDVQSSRP